MSIFKRVSTSLLVRIDSLVGKIENHDALIKASIQERKKKIAAAKVQLNRIRAREHQIDQQTAELRRKEVDWSERATREAAINEEQALLCLQRRQEVREQIARLNDAGLSYRQGAKKMTADIARCEQELKATVQKHDLLTARQRSAEALDFVHQAQDSGFDDLDTSFARWETQIVTQEINVDSADDYDQLEQEYLTGERKAQLRAELDALIKGTAQENDHGNA